MGKLAVFFCISTFFIISPHTDAHQQHVHQYIVREAYQLLKMYLGSIPVMEQHIGSNETGNNQPWHTGLVVSGAWREDVEDVIYCYDNTEPPGVSATHFWRADELGNENVTLSWVALGEVKNVTVPNAQKKMMSFVNGGWNLKFYYPNAVNSPVPICGFPSGIPIVGMSFKYNSLIDFYKTGTVTMTGILINPEGGWQYCEDGIEVTWGQSFREQLSYEILVECVI